MRREQAEAVAAGLGLLSLVALAIVVVYALVKTFT
jgi:hypothetical protein